MLDIFAHHLTWNGKSVVLDALPALEAILHYAVYMGHGGMGQCVILLGQCATVCQQHVTAGVATDADPHGHVSGARALRVTTVSASPSRVLTLAYYDGSCAAFVNNAAPCVGCMLYVVGCRVVMAFHRPPSYCIPPQYFRSIMSAPLKVRCEFTELLKRKCALIKERVNAWRQYFLDIESSVGLMH